MLPLHFWILPKQPRKRRLHWINKKRLDSIYKNIALDKNKNDCIKSIKKIALNK